MMKRFYEKISDLMFNFIYSDLMAAFILPLVMFLLITVVIASLVSAIIEIKNNSYIPVKYEFVTQDGEVKEGYGCRAYSGKGICIGDDGTKYFDIKSYKEIPVQETQEEVQETTNETKEYYLVIITLNDNYKNWDYETIKTHFKRNFQIDDEGVARVEIFCEKSEIDNIKQQLESDYLVQGYEILEIKRSDE